MENNTIQHVANTTQKSGKSRRGFASMDKERHKLVSSKGGKSLRTPASRNFALAQSNAAPTQFAQ